VHRHGLLARQGRDALLAGGGVPSRCDFGRTVPQELVQRDGTTQQGVIGFDLGR